MTTDEAQQQWENEFLTRFDRAKHMGEFLFVRRLNTKAMDDWNVRLAQIANLLDDEPGWFQRRTIVRVLGKFEDAALKQLRKNGLFEEWATSWKEAQPGE